MGVVSVLRQCSSGFRECTTLGIKIAKNLVAEWIHFTLFGIILPKKTDSACFLGLLNSATKKSLF